MTSFYQRVSVTYLAIPAQGERFRHRVFEFRNSTDDDCLHMFTSIFIVDTDNCLYPSVGKFKKDFLDMGEYGLGRQLENEVRGWCDRKGRKFVRITDVTDVPDLDESEEFEKGYFGIGDESDEKPDESSTTLPTPQEDSQSFAALFKAKLREISG